LAQGGKHKYFGNLPEYFNPRISNVKITMVIYQGIFITLVSGHPGTQPRVMDVSKISGANVIKRFCP
jgi:hypothetical protein